MLKSSVVLQRVRDLVSDYSPTNDQTKLTFTDAELDRHLAEAVETYSTYRPNKKRTTLTSVAGQDIYALPPDAAWIDNITTPDSFDLSYFYNAFGTWTFIQDIIIGDRDLIMMRNDLISLYAQFGQPIYAPYTLDDTGNPQVIFYPAPADANILWNIDYSALHVANANGDYATIPTADVQYIVSMMEAKCLDILATMFSKSGDYREGQTQVNFNPEDLRRRSMILTAQTIEKIADSVVAMRSS